MGSSKARVIAQGEGLLTIASAHCTRCMLLNCTSPGVFQCSMNTSFAARPHSDPQRYYSRGGRPPMRCPAVHPSPLTLGTRVLAAKSQRRSVDPTYPGTVVPENYSVTIHIKSY